MRRQGTRLATRSGTKQPIKPRRSSLACVARKSAFITGSQGPYLSAYAHEMAWRENNRRISNGEQYLMATDAALQHPISR